MFSPNATFGMLAGDTTNGVRKPHAARNRASFACVSSLTK
jgi:hypothetical protein